MRDLLRELRKAVEAAADDPHGGKVLLDPEVARRVLRELETAHA